MMKTILFGSIILLLLSAAAMADPSGVGINAGVVIPIVQDDQSNGHILGLKARFKLAGPVIMEPAISFAAQGSQEIAGVGKRDGFDITSYGVDLTLGGGLGGPGIRPYFMIGGGVYNLKRDFDETINRSGWNFGVGTIIGTQLVDVDLRGRIIIIATDEGGSRKAAGITAGLIYWFGRE